MKFNQAEYQLTRTQTKKSSNHAVTYLVMLSKIQNRSDTSIPERNFGKTAQIRKKNVDKTW